jgi:hypothetical protein
LLGLKQVATVAAKQQATPRLSPDLRSVFDRIYSRF